MHVLEETPTVHWDTFAFDHAMTTESSPSYALFECD